MAQQNLKNDHLILEGVLLKGSCGGNFLILYHCLEGRYLPCRVKADEQRLAICDIGFRHTIKNEVS